jgi:hypothetical protein
VEEPPRRIARSPDGQIVVRLAPREREILGAIAAELASEAAGEVMPAGGPDEPGLARLWPDAVAGDDEASAAFRELTEADLAEIRQARFATLAATLRAESLTDDEASAWMGVVNDLRLVRGTRLGVTEEVGREPIEESDPAAADTIVFLWLGWIEEQLVEAMATGLPEAETD